MTITMTKEEYEEILKEHHTEVYQLSMRLAKLSRNYDELKRDYEQLKSKYEGSN